MCLRHISHADMTFDFTNKRILVTGAGNGIGRALAKELSSCGAEVWGVSRTQANLDSLKEECPGIHTVAVDLSDWERTRSELEKLPSMHGLVNNAAITILERFLDVKPESFDRLYSNNVKQVINVSQIFGKKMVEEKISGSIVNLSSIASTSALVDHTLYCSAKAAVDMITKVAALELGPHNIRVNSVNPIVTMTTMGKFAWSDPVKSKPVLDRIPLGRFAEVEDVVNSIMFLLSDKATYLSANFISVDGGYLAT